MADARPHRLPSSPTLGAGRLALGAVDADGPGYDPAARDRQRAAALTALNDLLGTGSVGPPDRYYDRTTGAYLGEDDADTNDIRFITAETYDMHRGAPTSVLQRLSTRATKADIIHPQAVPRDTIGRPVEGHYVSEAAVEALYRQALDDVAVVDTGGIAVRNDRDPAREGVVNARANSANRTITTFGFGNDDYYRNVNMMAHEAGHIHLGHVRTREDNNNPVYVRNELEGRLVARRDPSYARMPAYDQQELDDQIRGYAAQLRRIE